MTRPPKEHENPDEILSQAPSAAAKRRFLAQVGAFATAGIALASTTGRPANAQQTDRQESVVVHATLADMLNDTRLAPGDFVSTQGYHRPGDHGGALYAILERLEGEPDGLGDHQLDNGLFCALQHAGTVHAEQFGATENRECSAGINAAMAHLLRWQEAQTERQTFIKLCHASAGTLSMQVRICRPGGRKAINCDLDFSQSRLTAVAGGNLDDQRAALFISARGYQQMGLVNGGRIAPCYLFKEPAGSTVIQPIARNFTGWGIKVTGASGNLSMIRPQADELGPSSALYHDESNYISDAFVADDGDFFVLAGKFRWARRTLYLTEKAHTNRFSECHFVNGYAGGKTDMRRQDPIIIENDSDKRNFLSGCYFDNGHIRDNGNSLQIDGGHYLNLRDRVDLRHPYIRVHASEPDQRATKFQMAGLAASVGFFPGSDGADWHRGWTNPGRKVWADQANISRRVGFASRLFNLFPGGRSADEIRQKPWGIFRLLWRLGDGRELAMNVDPGKRLVAIETSTLRASQGADGPSRILVGEQKTGIAAGGRATRQGGLELLHEDGRTVNVGQLPTSPEGLSPGDLWNDRGTLKIVS